MNETNYIERYWRDATLADAIKEPPMVARFRNSEEHVWVIGPLMGIRRNNFYQWYSTNLGSHKECQVYDAPDPGEGWRLVDVEKETPQHGDEFFAQSSKVWCFCNDVTRIATYSKGSIIRRRITPTVTYVPFTWEDRDQLRGRWIGSNNGEMERRITTLHRGKFVMYINGINASDACDDWHFLDTGKPVGKEVVQ